MQESYLLVLSAVSVIAMSVLVYYMIKAFENVGFTFAETAVIVFGSLVAYFFIPDIHLATVNNINFAGNVAGFLIPLAISLRLLVTGRAPFWKAVGGVIIVAYLVYTNSEVTLRGVLVGNIPSIILVASLYSLAGTRKHEERGPIAYISGTLGVILGADVFNLTKLSGMVPHNFSLIIGGAGLFDAIYLVGLFAIIVDISFTIFTKIYEKELRVMKGMNDGKVKELLNIAQKSIPLETRPFRVLGDMVGMSEKEVIESLRKLMADGIIRRIGPVLNPRGLGYESTLVAMKVDAEDTDRVAEIINMFPEVTHNYLRDADYNIWFTITAESRKRIDEILRKIRELSGYDVYDLPARRVFKIGVSFRF